MSKILHADSGFAQIPNALLNDESISFKAKGLFAFLFSKPNGWSFSAERMAKQTKDGVDSIYSGLKELEKVGYLERLKNQDGTMDYLLHIDKIPVCEIPSRGNSQVGKSPDISNKDILVIKNNSNKDNILQSDDCGNQINLLLNEFKEINPMTNFGNKTQRKALQELLDKFGYEKIKGSIDYLKTIISDKYAPVITTPVDLRNKIDKLSVYYLKNKQKITPIF